MNLKVLGAICNRIGAGRIDTANSGAEALEALGEHDYDFLLTDLFMPGMDGGELARNIRFNPRLAQMKIYAVTAESDNESPFDASHFDGIIRKPVTIKKLTEMLFPKKR